MTSLLGAPTAIERTQVFGGIWRQVVGLHDADQHDRDPDLLQVGRAVGAGPEMCSEPSAVTARESAGIGRLVDRVAAF
jgi:hypothetical protein